MVGTGSRATIIDRLVSANRQYYDTGTSDLTDDEYNALKDYASSIGIEVSTLTPPPKGSDWPARQHRRHMGSMELCVRDQDDFIAMCEDQSFDQVGEASIKYDGLSIEMQYTNGHLTAGVLRGDGNEGEDVFPNARRIGGVPGEISHDGDVSVFGEVVVSYNNLEALNEMRIIDGLEPYKSPRNAVALIRAKRANPHHLKLMVFRAFDTYPRFNSLRQSLNMHVLTRCTESGKTAFNPVDVSTVVAFSKAWNRRHEMAATRNEFQYQMDGMVFRCRDMDTCVKLKFPAESAITIVTGIVEQVGRTGVIAPVIKFMPVELAGATIVRASGHNARLMSTRLEGLGIGATVLISRRGDVIPHAEEVIVPAQTPWIPIEACPSCEAPIEQDGSIRRCSNDPSACSGTAMGLIMKFCMELGIDGFGPSVVSALMDSGMIDTPADLYMMDSEMASECIQPGGGRIGPSKAQKLIDAAVTRSEMTWGELLGAVGIPGCAKSVMESIANAFPDPDVLRAADLEGLAGVDGIGPERSEAIISFIGTRWDDVIGPLLAVVDLSRPGDQLSGQAFCITLSLRTCGRTEMESRIRRAGGIVKSSVSGKLDFLVCNQRDALTTKMRRARGLGIPIICEDELIKMIGGTPGRESDDAVNPDAEF